MENNKKRLIIPILVCVVLSLGVWFLFFNKDSKPVAKNKPLSQEQSYRYSKQILDEKSKLNFIEDGSSEKEIDVSELPKEIKEIIFNDTPDPVVKIVGEGSGSPWYKIEYSSYKEMPVIFSEYFGYLKDKAGLSILNASLMGSHSLIEYSYSEYNVKITMALFSTEVKTTIYAAKK